jgi:MFS-type transporter involved in bile tolerance (Atg22 family)
MVKPQRDGPIAAMTVGFLVSMVGADLAATDEVALALVLGGSVLVWGTILVMALYLDDEAWGRLLSDERTNRITYRSGATAWMATMAVAVTLSRAVDYTGRAVSTQGALLGVTAVAVASFVGAMGYHSRQM